ncbi:AbfB domain-containing protein [Streptomyces nojiriensis]|uniref:AbfB domain-containing protein n=1 Tax=Streptomyces nojiriensis TaxID=66374 RepID=UPI0036594DEA
MHNRNTTPLRQTVARGIVTGTALAAALGVATPGVALAAPSPTAPRATAQASGIGTTDTQRVEAAAVVRLDPAPDVLLLGDYDFVHALWQKARDGGERLDSVRAAAEQAMASTKAEDHARFIITGIHEAYRLDQQRERERAEAERVARLTKSQALLAVGIPSTPDLLALSDDNFIRVILKHEVSGPEVRAAAMRALLGEPADWREFIVNGARDAHKRDVANEVKELEEKNRKEAERLKELAARKSAAALFRITPSQAMLELSDDNFVRELLRLSPADLQGTELYATAQRAALASDPAAWKAFIHTGADTAYKRDAENRRKKLAAANRKLALQIQAAAEKTGVNPGLVAAAKAALAGGPEKVAEFLKEDNQYRARRQSFQSIDASTPGWYARQSTVDGGEGFLSPVDGQSPKADREAATWVVLPSLAGRPGCYSFESVGRPGYYLKVQETPLKAVVGADDRSEEFRNSATWCARPGLTGSGTTSFLWGVGPDERWLQPYRGYLYPSLYHPEWSGDAASWKIAPPLAG